MEKDFNVVAHVPNASQENCVVLSSNVDENVVTQPRKKRCLTYAVWKDCTQVTNPDGSITVQCKYCPHKTCGDSHKGTTHLVTHIRNYKQRPRTDKLCQQVQVVGSANNLGWD